MEGHGGDADASAQITPQMRLTMVREFAVTVFGKEAAAAAWLGRVHDAILGGDCIIATAVLTPEGFRQAMVELHRIHEQRAAMPAKPRSS